MRRKVGALGAGIAVAISLPGSAPAGSGSDADPAVFGFEDARVLDSFTLFWAGESVDGIPLTTVLRRDDTADLVSFLYGDCEPAADAGCAPPVEVQVWPACRRHLGLYRATPAGGPPLERITVRGVPGALLDTGTRLELQTADATVVVFAGSRDRALRVSSVLRAVGAGSVDALPPPVPGALEGRVPC